MSADPSLLTVGVPKETSGHERRVALVPADVRSLKKVGFEVLVETNAGLTAGFLDTQYTQQGARIAADRAELASAEIILHVRAGAADLGQPFAVGESLRENQILVAMCDPLSDPQPIAALADRRVTTFALELLPRITRAQSMDVLSSMATIAGYKAVVLAAEASPRMFPMMMTAAGTLTPAKVFVVGAGVAGLQAISTARRLGAIVYAYDVRPAAREQIQSVGGKPVDFGLESAEGQGGYARAMDQDYYKRQQAAMAKVVAESDVVITTAAVPGKRAPILITNDMLMGMSPGSVVVDLAAERGGNCEATKAGETVEMGGAVVIGPVNLPATVAHHASQMFSRNVTAFLLLLKKSGLPALDTQDEIVRDTLITRDGRVVNPQIRERLAASVS
ncbi:MAG TPA: NAD(P) transhydrogenase subunit alpha [Planctomycetaceae bacterium]|jgi:NAD(P) transhydrogenase subunit alpha|nr:NAD(P) transhydrogenase subunit alpha [Planctomycetaceae bacterium]